MLLCRAEAGTLISGCTVAKAVVRDATTPQGELRTEAVTLVLYLWRPPCTGPRGEGQTTPHARLKAQLCL